MMKLWFKRGFLVLLIGSASPLFAEEANHLLWTDKPVIIKERQANSLKDLDNVWSHEVFPIGNGRLGCAVFGLPALDRIQFNEDSLWVGNELVQSHLGCLHLLPALQQEWNSGSVRGMRVRGGFELDLSWDEGKLSASTLRNVSNAEGRCRMKIGAKEIEFNIEKGKQIDVKLPE